MREMVDGWEVVSCRVKGPWHMMYMVLQMLVGKSRYRAGVFNSDLDRATDRYRNGTKSDGAFHARSQGQNR